MKCKLLVGETEDSIIELQFELCEHLSLSGHQYSKPAFTEEEGEERAREYLEDGELWKMCVQNDNTTLGHDDWIEHVLSIDGWMETLGDIFVTKDGKYVSLDSCGQIDMHLKPSDFTKIFIAKEDLDFIFKCWKKYHLKPLSKVPKGTIVIMERIFQTQTTIEDWDSRNYIDLKAVIELCKTNPDKARMLYSKTISTLIRPETIKLLMALDFQELEKLDAIPSLDTHIQTAIEDKDCPFLNFNDPKFNEITAPHWKGDMREYYVTARSESEIWQMVIDDLEEALK